MIVSRRPLQRRVAFQQSPVGNAHLYRPIQYFSQGGYAHSDTPHLGSGLWLWLRPTGQTLFADVRHDLPRSRPSAAGMKQAPVG